MQDKQLTKLQRLAKLADQGELGVLSELNALDEKIDKVEEKAENANITANDALKIVSGELKLPYLKGDKGDSPIKGVDYEDGHDYVLTEIDKKEIASKIKVPVVEKVIEKTEVIHEQPIVKETVKETITKVQDESAESLRDKLASLDGDARLDKSAIKGLDEAVKQSTTQYFGGNGVLTIRAGAGISIDNTKQRHPIITATGGGGSNFEVPTGDLNQDTFVWTTAHDLICVDGKTFPRVQQNGDVNWTVSGSAPNITTVMTVWPTESISGF